MSVLNDSEIKEGPFCKGNSLHEVYHKAGQAAERARNFADMLADWELMHSEQNDERGVAQMCEVNKQFFQEFENAHYSLIEQVESYVEKLHAEYKKKAD